MAVIVGAGALTDIRNGNGAGDARPGLAGPGFLFAVGTVNQQPDPDRQGEEEEKSAAEEGETEWEFVHVITLIITFLVKPGGKDTSPEINYRPFGRRQGLPLMNDLRGFENLAGLRVVLFRVGRERKKPR
jgi:hypothetical protein